MKLFHISTDLTFKEYFIPRIPISRSLNENDTIPRICFSTSIEGCLTSMPDGGIKFKDLYKKQSGCFRLYEIDLDELSTDSYKTAKELWKSGLVEDADDCGEYWILSPIHFKRDASSIIHIDSWEESEDDIIPYDVYVESEKNYGGDYCRAYENMRGQKISSVIFIEDVKYKKVSLKDAFELQKKLNLEFKVESVNNLPSDMDFSFAGDCLHVYLDGILVALLDYYIFEDTFFINQIEVFKGFRGKGIGTSIIKKILCTYPIKYIKGMSTEEAVQFYNNIGCTFYETCKDCSYTGCSKHPQATLDAIESEDICDDYTENNFEITLETITV